MDHFYIIDLGEERATDRGWRWVIKVCMIKWLTPQRNLKEKPLNLRPPVLKDHVFVENPYCSIAVPAF